jgi:hypothetical protein
MTAVLAVRCSGGIVLGSARRRDRVGQLGARDLEAGDVGHALQARMLKAFEHHYEHVIAQVPGEWALDALQLTSLSVGRPLDRPRAAGPG